MKQKSEMVCIEDTIVPSNTFVFCILRSQFHIEVSRSNHTITITFIKKFVKMRIIIKESKVN